MRHIVMYSGGIGSWATAKQVIDTHGADDVTLLFADVQGDNNNPHLGEDEDSYRFIHETSVKWGVELVWLSEGRSIWQVFHDNRFLGNSRLANCSKFLKQRPCREWLHANTTPDDAIVYVGIDWSESHRLPAIEHAYLPWIAKAPLCDPPYTDKQSMLVACRQWGVEPPLMYSKPYPHANCGGFCVRAGQAQFRLLLNENRERFLYHENEEQELRAHLGKDVAILRDRTDGTSTPLTLQAFRERQEEQPALFDDLDWGGCGCFTENEGGDE